MEAMQLVSGPHLLESMEDTSVGMWPSEFALMIGVSVSTLQNWEQGRRNPDGPARALLKVASENPEAVRGYPFFRRVSSILIR